MKCIHKLKFSDKKESDSIFFQEEKPNWMASIETIVEIGVIIKPATYDEDGNELIPAQVVDGWHVDILAHSLIDELKEYCLDHVPESPVHGSGWAENDYYIVTKDSY